MQSPLFLVNLAAEPPPSSKVAWLLGAPLVQPQCLPEKLLALLHRVSEELWVLLQWRGGANVRRWRTNGW